MHLSPDGRFLAFVEGYELYVTRVPALGVSFKVGPKQSAIPQVLSEYGADYVAWSSDGSRISWSMGATHFTYDVSEFPLTERIQTVSLAQSVPVDQPSQRLALVNAQR